MKKKSNLTSNKANCLLLSKLFLHLGSVRTFRGLSAIPDTARYNTESVATL